ncbi:MAG: ferredoxin reductase family protein [Actinomycetota bacterium]
MLTEQPSARPAAAAALPWRRRVLGRPSDWHLRRPSFHIGRPRLAWLGPIAVVVSTLVGWFAFQGAQGEEGGSVAFGLFIGAASIVLMAWSFVLAIRIRFLERFFGGLDSMYRVHRWAGSLAIVAMFLHTSAEPEIEGGIRGASESLADQAEGVAGFGEMMLYVLIGLSLLRWFPYRWWRLSHKLLGIPFAFASWHFFTAEKTYANGSPWGWYFGLIMLAGLAGWIWRSGVISALLPGHRYRVASAIVRDTTLDLELEPDGRPMTHEAGQFAVVKIQKKGLTEPHVFTIASPPDAGRLRFYIRDLGDWSAKLLGEDLVGSRVIVEGPYGRFDPYGNGDGHLVWVAGGVGITPFLSAIAALPAGVDVVDRPTLVYCVPREADATAIEALRQAEADGRIRLEVFASREGRRFTPARFSEVVGDRLAGAHVAVCGPAGLVADVAETARRGGAHEIETEDFDIRSGFGPDMSREIEHLIAARRER